MAIRNLGNVLKKMYHDIKIPLSDKRTPKSSFAKGSLVFNGPTTGFLSESFDVFRSNIQNLGRG